MFARLLRELVGLRRAMGDIRSKLDALGVDIEAVEVIAAENNALLQKIVEEQGSVVISIGPVSEQPL